MKKSQNSEYKFVHITIRDPTTRQKANYDI